MRPNLPILFTLLPFVLCAQLELLTDFNPGSESAFYCNNCENDPRVEVNGGLLLIADGGNTGQELALLRNGELTLLRDINTGAEDSNIGSLTEYNGEVYFRAFDATNGTAIWTTDGTPEGTVLVFDPDPEDNRKIVPYFAIADDGTLFVVHDGTLYRRDGEDTTVLATDVPIGSDYLGRRPVIAPYKGGVVYVTTEEVEDGGGLFYATDTVVRLATIDGQTQFDRLNALYVRGENIFFINFAGGAGPSRSGTYHYDGAAGTFGKLQSASGYDVSINQWFGGGLGPLVGLGRYDDLYSIDASGLATSLLLGDINTTADEEIPFVRNDSLVFYPWVFNTFGGNDQLAVVNINSGEASLIAEARTSRSFRLLLDDDQLYFATDRGTFDPIKFFRYDLETKEVTELYEVADTVFYRLDGIQLLTVQNDTLYVALNIDDRVGYELYTLPVGSPPSAVTRLRDRVELDVRVAGQEYQVVSDDHQPVSLSVYDSSGRLIDRRRVAANKTLSIPPFTGMHIYYFEQGHRGAVRKIAGFY